jgi:phospholipid/cholesterol/gamma-HCH transport system ATP-binding protein
MLLIVDNLEMRFGTRLIQKQVSFRVDKGCIFAIMGGSGCGKSTLLKHLVGLLAPAGGTVTYDDIDFWTSDDAQRSRLRSRFGMLFQSAALWSSMTLLENVCLPLAWQTGMGVKERESKAREVLKLVDLADFAQF